MRVSASSLSGSITSENVTRPKQYADILVQIARACDCKVELVKDDERIELEAE
ncbi:MAG: hypothetical protein J6D54_10490 [Olsenella sp.]|nr:hypothetical protein [Olsenella sp.]